MNLNLCILFIRPAPWVGSLSPAEVRNSSSGHLVVFLNSLLEKYHVGLGTGKASCGLYLSCRHEVFYFSSSYCLTLSQCLFQAGRRLFWLGCEGRAVKPKCCFSFLPRIFVCLSHLLLFSHNFWKEFSIPANYLLCWELAKDWCQSYEVVVQQWGSIIGVKVTKITS